MGYMSKEDYGDEFQDHLLEQYKLYVEMADRISIRRAQANKFFISLLSGLLAVLSIATNKGILTEMHNALFLAVSLLGLILGTLWYVTINSYRQLNSAKFKLIHEMEQYLPFPCYKREWGILRKEGKGKKYLQITHVEKFIPFILALPYFLLFIYSLVILISKK